MFVLKKQSGSDSQEHCVTLALHCFSEHVEVLASHMQLPSALQIFCEYTRQGICEHTAGNWFTFQWQPSLRLQHFSVGKDAHGRTTQAPLLHAHITSSSHDVSSLCKHGLAIHTWSSAAAHDASHTHALSIAHSSLAPWLHGFALHTFASTHTQSYAASEMQLTSSEWAHGASMHLAAVAFQMQV
eukprot:TRINITY_DN1577_c0_g4_i1.p3 TRINITY_DN1577_c0_g4~~TRINITY_DN1577_c0_g4_i1.p3  ORF type:complete len:185 (-),score=10.61 TRINITY_DN1577_c0_g4_i1:531-1085(-)